MKKAYRKPVLIVEQFALSQTIAHNCGDNLLIGHGTQSTKETCGWDIGRYEIFMNPNICDHSAEHFDFVCYNAPAGGYNIFNS